MWLPDLQALYRLAVSAVACSDADVSYSHRVQDKDHYNFCVVPQSGADAILFISIAILAACICSGSLSALYVLMLGGLCQALAFPMNLGRFGNSIALFLGVEPADVFLYVFLPPLLFDASVRIYYFVFKKMIFHVICFAFLIVMASTAMFVPVLLYVFNLKAMGWTWEHAALFGAMIASTDAVAVSAILKKGGAPEKLLVLMEGESLFNDATSIVLFEIFFSMVKRKQKGHPSTLGFLEQAAEILSKIAWLAFGGAMLGLAFGILTRLVLKWMHRRGHKAPEQLALTVAMAYLSFYVANGEVSGVIAVVVFGLYGSATGKWHMSPRVVENGSFDTFWDTVCFAFNSLVFFFAGASSINFFWRSSQELYEDEGNFPVLFTIFWRLPLIFVATMIVRGVCIMLFNPLFKLAKSEMSWAEIVFATIGGLRGAVSLILAQVVVTEQNPDPSMQDRKVTAELALWTAGIVVCTLMVNAPLMPALLRWTRLNAISAVKIRMRGKAARALLRYTNTAIDDLQHDEDEMLRGVDWAAVETFVDLRKKLGRFEPSSKGSEPDPEEEESTFEKTAGWISEAATVVGKVIKTGRASVDEKRPLLEPDEEMGLAGGATLTTLDEVEDENEQDAERDRRNPEEVAANKCAANLLLASSTVQSAPTGAGQQCGTVIGAAEGNREMMTRHQGFGAYDVPFLEKKKYDGDSKDDEEGEEDQHVHLEEDEEEPEVLDLESPAFDIRSPEELPAQPSQTDIVDKMEFEAEDTSTSATGTLSQRSSLTEITPPFPGTTLPQPNVQSPFTQAAAGTPEGCFVSEKSLEDLAGLLADPPRISPRQESATPLPPNSNGAGSQHAADGCKLRATAMPQPMIIPRMVKAGEAKEGQGEKPHMRWVSMSSYQPWPESSQTAHKGSAVLRANPNEAVGVSFSFTDTAVPTPGGNRRTLGSKKRRAETRALRKAMSGPLQHAGSDVTTSADRDEDGDDMDDDELDPQDPEVLAEVRVRLVAGLKRYFHEKRGQGLLTGPGILVLDHACDAAMDSSAHPLIIWKLVESEVCGRWSVRLLSRSLFWLRRFSISAQSWGPRFLVRHLLLLPATGLAEVLGSQLSRVMLLAIEVAVEYWLALTWSPQAQWLNEVAKSGIIQSEVKSESKRVWKFIIEREIEAPARFQAIQTHRAAMALLRQQGLFVEQLYNSGMVDEAEKEALLEPIEKNERLLLRKGALGRSPKIDEVLRNLPFLKGLPRAVFEALLARGNLIKFSKGEVIYEPPVAAHLTARGGPKAEGGPPPREGPGIHIVLAGLVKSSYVATDGHVQEYFLGSGGAFGLLSTLVGESLPGSGPYVAVGNALNQGPVLYHFPQSLITAVRERAAAGDMHLRQLELDLFRVAALYLVERLKSEVIMVAATHYQAMAVGHARRRALKRLARYAAASKKGPVNAYEIWSRVCHSDKARQVLASELMHALEGPLNPSMSSKDEEQLMQKPEASRTAYGNLGSYDAGQNTSGQPLEGPTDSEIVSSLDPRRVWKRVRKHAAHALLELKQGLRDAELITLKPGESLLQHSSWVLLVGSLSTTGSASAVPAGIPVRRLGRPHAAPAAPEQQGLKGNLEVSVQYNGPAVLPWLWQPVEQDGEVILQPQPIPHIAGPSGAVIVACQVDTTDSDSEMRSEGSPSEPMPDSPATDLSASPPQRRSSAERPGARQARMRTLPGDNSTDGGAEHIGPIHSSTYSSKRMRVISVKRMLPS